MLVVGQEISLPYRPRFDSGHQPQPRITMVLVHITFWRWRLATQRGSFPIPWGNRALDGQRTTCYTLVVYVFVLSICMDPLPITAQVRFLICFDKAVIFYLEDNGFFE